jgi:tryptophan synthase beta chain
MLHDSGRAEYVSRTDSEALEACRLLARLEGIIPALESAHAIAETVRRAPASPGKLFLVNLSGRGDKDMEILERELKL